MKRLPLFALFWVLLLGLSSATSIAMAQTGLRIAMVQWRGETEACRGFMDAMKDSGYSPRYTVLNAAQDRKRLATLLRNELAPNLDEFDYVYSYGTTASKMTKTILDHRVPHVFSNVAAPVESGIAHNMQSAGPNMSGTSNRVPLSLQIETAMKVLKFKKLGIFFNPREKNAMVIRNELYELGKSHGFEVVDFRSPPSQDKLNQNLQVLERNPQAIDAVYLPLDSFLMTRASSIGSALRSINAVSIAAQKKYIENGALFGTIPDYYKLGRIVASIVIRHQNGEDLEGIPIATPIEPTLMVNLTTARMLGIEFPESLLKKAIVVEQ